ncbi:MAG TPA: SGNH/GDSL hydrolase family protein [Bryobacteraceae bacterium]|jgi:lysophospholipase L1-like esterase
MKLRVVFVVAMAALCHSTLIQAQSKGQEHWVATWGTAELLVRTPPPPVANGIQPPPRSGTTPGPQSGGEAAARPTPQQINARGFNNQTVRMIVRTSLGGRRLRVGISNAFGSAPVELGAAHIALRTKDSEIDPKSDHALTFSGKPGCRLGPGVVLLSDPVELTVPPVTDLAVSLFFPGTTGPPTSHATALHTTYISNEGDATAQASMPDAITTQSYYYLATVDVMAQADAALIVTYGDSITDGARSNNETNHSWPALLAARLAAKKETAHIGVSNMGIGGNRVLRDGSGASALARLDRDVFSQAGVKWLMLLEGINDIGREVATPAEATTADELIAAYKQIIERAHTHGIVVIGCTLTPYGGAGYQRDTGEAVREGVNQWIRTSGAFDAVVDFEAATRDPDNPKRFRADFDPGDHLHPNDAGYQSMADAIDLSIFAGKHAAAVGSGSKR